METLMGIGLGLGMFLGVLGMLKGRRWGADVQLTKDYKIGDFLVSQSFPLLKLYKLKRSQYTNLQQLANRIQALNDKMGERAHINSGGRPQDFADFVTALRNAGYHAVDNSKHGLFQAADIAYSTPERTEHAYRATLMETWGERIYDPDRHYLHLALPAAERVPVIAGDEDDCGPDELGC